MEFGRWKSILSVLSMLAFGVIECTADIFIYYFVFTFYFLLVIDYSMLHEAELYLKLLGALA